MQRHVKVRIQNGKFKPIGAENLPIWFQDKMKRRFIIPVGDNAFKVTTSINNQNVDVKVDDAILCLDDNDRIEVRFFK